MDRKILLKVDGKEIPMNSFVREVFINVIDGLIDSLDKIPEDKKTIEVLIEKQ